MSDEPEGLDNEPEYEVKKDYTTTKTDLTKERVVDGKKIPSVIESAKILKEIEPKIKKESKKKELKDYPKGRNDFDEACKMLQRNQYNIYEDPDNHYCEITIPKKVTLGEDLVIKLSRKVKKVQYLFGDGYKWTKTNSYDPKSDFDLTMRPTLSLTDENFDSDKIVIPTGQIKTINKADYQMWLTGHYYLTVRVYDKEWHEDTVAKTMVELVA